MTDIMQKVAQVAPRHYNFLMKTASEIKESPFRDEIIAELDSLIKTALDWGAMGGAMGGGAKAVGKGALALAGAAGTAAAGGIAIALAGDMYEAAKRGITKSRNYKGMMEANPNLKELPAKEVQRAFSVLHRFNPEFSSDPTVAGAWVANHATTAGMDAQGTYGNVTTLNSLIQARKGIADTKKINPFAMPKEPKPGKPGLRGRMGLRGRTGPAGPEGPQGPEGPAGANLEMYPAQDGGWRTSPPR